MKDNAIINKVFGKYVKKAWKEFGSLLLDLSPIGDVKMFCEGWAGHDLITNRKFSWYESAFCIGAGALGIFGKIKLIDAAYQDSRLATELSEMADIAGDAKAKRIVEDIIKSVPYSKIKTYPGPDTYFEEMRDYIIVPQDPYSVFLEREYIKIRKLGFTDVKKIAKNAGLPEQDIINIKKHIFFNAYDLSVGCKPYERLYF